MTERKQDWDVITGWEKRIKVDFGSLGKDHVRWSHWTYKERDIVARKVHESAGISRDHGPRSRRMEDWAKEHAPIMIDFARDHKPMPDWAHADYRESGIPEHVKVVWKRDDPGNPASKGDWAYEPEYPWEAGEEPAWSAPAKIIGLETEGSLDSKFGGVVTYRTAANGDHIANDGTVISTKESRAKQDVPQWRKFELGRLEIVDNVVIPGPSALDKDIEQYGENVKLTGRHKVEPAKPVKIMPGDPNHTPLEKAQNWAAETHHGPAHQDRWNRVAAALGADNGYSPMTHAEVTEQWERFNRNARWSVALDALKTDDTDDLVAVNRYRESAGLQPIKKSQQEKLRDALVEINDRDDVEVREFNPDTQTLDVIESGPKPQYRIQGTMDYGPNVPKPGSTGWYTREIKWLPKWYWELPAITDDEAKEQGATSRASVAPLNYIYHKKGTGILGRQKPAPVREDLPIWTKAEAAAYYQAKGIKMRSRQWLDGHLMQHPGYTDNGQGSGKFVARAASEEYEASHKSIAVPKNIAAAVEAGGWDAVVKPVVKPEDLDAEINEVAESLAEESSTDKIADLLRNLLTKLLG